MVLVSEIYKGLIRLFWLSKHGVCYNSLIVCSLWFSEVGTSHRNSFYKLLLVKDPPLLGVVLSLGESYFVKGWRKMVGNGLSSGVWTDQ